MELEKRGGGGRRRVAADGREPRRERRRPVDAAAVRVRPVEEMPDPATRLRAGTEAGVRRQESIGGGRLDRARHGCSRGFSKFIAKRFAPLSAEAIRIF